MASEESVKEAALITGASGGIGLELARVFASHGHPLILVARNTEKLRALQSELEQSYGAKVLLISKDLSRPGSAEELFREIYENGSVPGILVNNAGVGVYGAFADADLSKELDMLQLNVTTLTHLTKLFLREMVKKGRGRILNVASTAAFQPGPFMAIYYATKAYVLFFSEAISCELEGTGVTVTTLCPGPTQTGFSNAAGIGKNVKLFKYGVMDALSVARAGYEGMMKGKRLILPGLQNKISPLGARFFPRNLILKIVRKIQGGRHL